jgi:hypothetical protein
MSLALKHRRSYGSIREVGAQHYDYHNGVATKVQRQVNPLLDYKIRWSRSRIVQLLEYNIRDLLPRETKPKSH